MKTRISGILVPALLVSAAVVQSFGIDLGRALARANVGDTTIVGTIADTIDKIAASDSIAALPDSLALAADSIALAVDSIALAADSLEMAADSEDFAIPVLDTLRIPDSLEFKDPFKFKYFTAIKDSATRVAVRDSLISAGDSLELHKLDSLYLKDSTEVARWRFAKWYQGLDKKERKKYELEKKMAAKLAHMDTVLARKDSIRAVKDSIIENTPRILETGFLADSLQYKRILMWTHDRKFNDIKLQKLDTSYNYHFNDYPFYKEDMNVTYLGVSGSAEQSYDFFKRRKEENVYFYDPYQIYTYTPETLPQYNTKTPYTELAYWGTLFSTKEKEENDIKILTTQNITPELNLHLEYDRYGGKGILKNESTDNRTSVIAMNYMGKKYLAHAGFIHHKVSRKENGGVIDLDDDGFSWIRDTIVDAREISVRLANASNLIKKNTVFLDQSYRIPLDFLRKIGKKDRDTLSTKDVTTAFIGHTSEYSAFRKVYTDAIGTGETAARELYNNRFYINPTKSNDSLRVSRFENRLFMRLQPWKADGIVSKLDVGIGDKLLSYYMFSPGDYLMNPKNTVRNNMYAYAGAQGQYKKYLSWDADGRYTFLGKEINDFEINANLAFSAYPFRRHKDSPLTIGAHFSTTLKEPDYFEQHYYSNHYVWDNDFSKISTTKIEGVIDIPHWKLSAGVGYALLANNLYYDTEAIIRQNTTAMSVLSAKLNKEFTLWHFHFDHRLLAQISSNQDVVPLPLFSANLKYFFQFDVVKKVMQMQLGVNALWTTAWHAPAYSPALGVFHNQDEYKYGVTPYMDAFVNIQWKRACIFVKFVNANMGWPLDDADYFSAHHYIRPQRAIRVGLFWPFYTMNASASSSSGSAGSRSSSGGLSSGPGKSPSGRKTAKN